MTSREMMEYDVVIVGAGPSGLSSAIKLKQLSKKNNKEISICIVEKGSEVGSHILSGAVIETKSLEELIPDWKEREDFPLERFVEREEMVMLRPGGGKFKAPILPPEMINHGKPFISLGRFCQWLGEIAEEKEQSKSQEDVYAEESI